MKIKQFIAATVVAGGLTLGTAGIASAADTAGAPAPTRPTTEQVCQRAKLAWDRLTDLDKVLHDHYARLETLRQKAVDAGRQDLVAKIDNRLALVRDRHERIVNRLQAIHDKVKDRCTDIPEPTDSAL